MRRLFIMSVSICVALVLLLTGCTKSLTGKIVFSSLVNDYFGEIYVMDVDGRGQIRIDSGTYPSWSPDGKKIAFYSILEGNANIYVTEY